MAKEVKRRKGTTIEHQNFTGAEAEWTYDTDKKTIVVHDGTTQGGFALAREDGSNLGSLDLSGNLTVQGDLQVNGTTTTINTSELTVDDINITIADGAVDAVAADGAGITIDGANATILYQSAGDNFALNKDLNVTGSITLDGTVDGRDVSVDGSKLDGIESGATADQTASEIKTLYESNANTNAFTDADESKLDNIEASADVTDTANVTAAGALMDSELTNEAAVKAINQQLTTTSDVTFNSVTANEIDCGSIA